MSGEVIIKFLAVPHDFAVVESDDDAAITVLFANRCLEIDLSTQEFGGSYVKWHPRCFTLMALKCLNYHVRHRVLCSLERAAQTTRGRQRCRTPVVSDSREAPRGYNTRRPLATIFAGLV